MKLFRSGFPGKWLYSDAIFRIETSEKILFLTFDDGPDPSSTPELLDKLKRYNVKAAFFCNGKAAEENPGLLKLIINEGHLAGNHGFDHLNGWLTGYHTYINDIRRASVILPGRLFRPPYGRIGYRQYLNLRRTFKIIFWDLMCYDFDTNFGMHNSLKILKNKIRPGSVIVLHDTPTSCANNILDDFLTFAIESGYRFELFPV